MQPDQFIDEGDVGVSGAADQAEEMGDTAGGVNGAMGGGVSLRVGVKIGGWDCRVTVIRDTAGPLAPNDHYVKQ